MRRTHVYKGPKGYWKRLVGPILALRLRATVGLRPLRIWVAPCEGLPIELRLRVEGPRLRPHGLAGDEQTAELLCLLVIYQ